MDLLAFERKLDQTIMRKRLDIQEALKRPIKVTGKHQAEGSSEGTQGSRLRTEIRAQQGSPWHLNCIFPFRLQTRNYIRNIGVEQLAGQGAGELSAARAPEIDPVRVLL